MDRQVVVASNKTLVRNEGFFRSENNERGLECSHPDADCGRSNSRLNESECGAHCSRSVGNRFPWYDIPFGVMVPAHRHQASNFCWSLCACRHRPSPIPLLALKTCSWILVLLLEWLYFIYWTSTGRRCWPKGACAVKGAVQDTNVSAVQSIYCLMYTIKSSMDQNLPLTRRLKVFHNNNNSVQVSIIVFKY